MCGTRVAMRVHAMHAQSLHHITWNYSQYEIINQDRVALASCMASNHNSLVHCVSLYCY